MRKILDKIFSNSKWCVLIPILVAMCIYLAYILFGNYNTKVDAVLALPIISVFWFFGVFLVLYIQIKNTMCPEWFLNLFELIVMLVSGIYAISSIVRFFISGYLDYGLCIGLLTYSSVCWAHSKRTK